MNGDTRYHEIRWNVGFSGRYTVLEIAALRASSLRLHRPIFRGWLSRKNTASIHGNMTTWLHPIC